MKLLTLEPRCISGKGYSIITADSIVVGKVCDLMEQSCGSMHNSLRSIERIAEIIHSVRKLHEFGYVLLPTTIQTTPMFYYELGKQLVGRPYPIYLDFGTLDCHGNVIPLYLSTASGFNTEYNLRTDLCGMCKRKCTDSC